MSGNYNYQPPVDKLLTLGDAHTRLEGWPDYLALGLSAQQIPDLIRMAADEDLHWADSDALEVWAPIHAWRALGQLRAEAAVDPLLQQIIIRNSADEYGYDDWTGEELPIVFGMIGAPAIPKLIRYMRHHARFYNHYPGIAATGLRQIAEQHPELRDECIATLRDQLAKFNDNIPELNAELIAELVNLQATDLETLKTIKAAYFANQVDLTINGNWGHVKEALKLDPALDIPGEEPDNPPIPPLFEEFPALRNFLLGELPPDEESFPLSLPDPTDALIPRFSPKRNLKKVKSKRKQEKKSRRQNRKRK